MESHKKRKLFIGTVDTLFDIEVQLLYDGNDDILMKAYDAVFPESEVSLKSELDDGNDDYLNDCYNAAFNRIPDNMLKYVNCTKQEITYKKLIAQVKMKDKKCGNYIRSVISDRFWSIEEWPLFAIEILFSKNFSYTERISLAAFLHGNNLRCAGTARLIFQFYNDHWNNTKRWTQKFYKFDQLFNYLDKAFNKFDPDHDRIRTNYWYFDMQTKQTLFYDGMVRTKNGDRIFFRNYNKYN